MALVGTAITEAGIKSEFFQRFSEVNEQTYWAELSTRIPTNRASEKFAFLGSVPQMREWGTGRLAKGLFDETYDIQAMKYEATLEVDRDELDDDQTGQLRVRIRELADRAATHKDREIERLLINGATAGFHSFDGVPFFDATHVFGNSGAQDNDIGASASTATDPTVAEFRKSLSAAIAQLLSFKDDQGQPKSQSARGFFAVVPATMYVTALEAVNATMVNSTSAVALSGAAKVITLPGLSTASVWYLLKTDASVRPFVFLDRAAVEFKALAEGSGEEFLREKYYYGVRARYRIAYGDWAYAVRVTFSE